VTTQRYVVFWWNHPAEAGYAACGDKSRYKTCKTTWIDRKNGYSLKQPVRMTSSRRVVMIDGAVMRRLRVANCTATVVRKQR
jgi:hypothetical protein